MHYLSDHVRKAVAFSVAATALLDAMEGCHPTPTTILCNVGKNWTTQEARTGNERNWELGGGDARVPRVFTITVLVIMMKCIGGTLGTERSSQRSALPHVLALISFSLLLLSPYYITASCSTTKTFQSRGTGRKRHGLITLLPASPSSIPFSSRHISRWRTTLTDIGHYDAAAYSNPITSTPEFASNI